MFYNFRICYSTVSNMKRYGHKCHFKILVFYSTFSLSSQYLIQRFLSLRPMFSPSFFFRSPPSPSKQRYGSLTDQAANHRCGFVPMVDVDVSLCRWWIWVWDVGLFGLVNVGLWHFVPISLVVGFFIYLFIYFF